MSGPDPEEYVEKIFSDSDGSEQTEDYWETALGVSQSTFDMSIESIRSLREDSLEMLKINLLLTSVYVAAVRYTGLSTVDWKLIGLPFALVIVSSIIFILSYSEAGDAILGANRQNIEQSASDSLSRKEYLRIMTVTYVQWAENNLSKEKIGGKLMNTGISLQLVSVGTLTVIYILTQIY